MKELSWLALMIGNSRLHWAGFTNDLLAMAWDTSLVAMTEVQTWVKAPTTITQLYQTWPATAISWLFNQPNPVLPLWLASVVPSQSKVWSNYPRLHQLTLAEVPLDGIYPTLGLDRALALWGAGQHYRFPQLVIDAGTALTFTGADDRETLVGGAILPGLRTQFQSLATQTAQLPEVAWLATQQRLPSRWAMDTETAIASGILHTVLAGVRAFIQDWRQSYPNSAVTLTGGDATFLWDALKQLDRTLADSIQIDPYLIFWGMQACRKT